MLHLEKVKNLEKRTREYLLPNEVEAMIKAARQVGRHCLRDATLILLVYRHGLRISELVALRWSQVDSGSGTIYINRLKNGVSATHPLHGPELRVLRRLQREYPDSPYLFVPEHRTVMTRARARGIISRADTRAGLPLSVHPYMLRHACGFYSVAQGYNTRAIQSIINLK